MGASFRAMAATVLLTAMFVGVSSTAGSRPAAAAAGSETFTSNGNFTVPVGVYEVEVDLSGASGGRGGHNGSNRGGNGGVGTRLIATVPVEPGDVLRVRLGDSGERGSDSDKDNWGYGGTGWPGSGGRGDTGSHNGRASGGGGGSSDVLLNGSTILVAGGGGGGGGGTQYDWGGDGGSDGGWGHEGGTGAGGGAGGSGQRSSSSDGEKGENASTGSNNGAGGGGGGGWRGGLRGEDGSLVYMGGGGGAAGSSKFDFIDLSSVSRRPADPGGGRAVLSWNQVFPTTTDVHALPDEIVVGADAVFEVEVTAPEANGVPIGAVQLRIDGSDVGSPLTVGSDGLVHFEVTDLEVGDHAVDALFLSGHGDFGDSAGSTSLRVGPDTTTTLVASNENPSVIGQPVTFTASVTAATEESGVPEGSVTFLGDGEPIGDPVELDEDGRAAITTDELGLSTTVVEAVYGASDRHVGSEAALDQVVNRGDVGVVVDSDVNPSVFGEEVTFEARVGVIEPAAGELTGTILFHTEDGPLADPVPVDEDGRATLAVDDLAVGVHDLTATYDEDELFEPANSAAHSQVVNPGDVEVSLDVDRIQTTVGLPVTLDASVSVVDPAVGELTGAIRFESGGTPIGDPVPVDDAGRARLVTRSLPIGTNEIIAHYVDDENFDEAASAPRTVVIEQGDIEVGLRVQPTRTLVGDEVTFDAFVSPTNEEFGDPTGTITFHVDGLPISEPIPIDDHGRATFRTTNLEAGRHVVIAMYGGDENFSRAASPMSPAQVDEPDRSGPSSGRFSAGGSGKPLAATGAPIRRQVVGAIALLGLGVGAVVTASRRRTRRV